MDLNYTAEEEAFRSEVRDFLSKNVPADLAGRLSIELEYRIRATNSRFNLVLPFNELDANELRFPRSFAATGRN